MYLRKAYSVRLARKAFLAKFDTFRPKTIATAIAAPLITGTAISSAF